MSVGNRILGILQGSCHGPSAAHSREENGGSVVIVGSPNVGKSVLFHRLTGSYVTVSNYPGTTVEVFRGKGTIGGASFAIIDTPGFYSFLPITEEERVTRNVLLAEKPDVVLHVVDAKNLERMLPLTLQLLEAELPVILVLNIIDEAERKGIRFDLSLLEKRLGVPVFATSSTTGRGIEALVDAIACRGEPSRHVPLEYTDPMEGLLKDLSQMLQGRYAVSRKSIATLLLQQDSEVVAMARNEERDYGPLARFIEEAGRHFPHPVSYELALQRQRIASGIVNEVTQVSGHAAGSGTEWLNRLLITPWTGVPILLLILYYGIYKFVGDFGAGVLVDFLEGTVFEQYINPLVTSIVLSLLPWASIQALFVGEYGVITLGFRYAVALILPIVTTFFLAFSILEDSGYLPRLSLLIDRLFKTIGLTGRAVIPMVLGLGCDTMATMVTRTLATKRERVIATLLLALAIPCSAQLGVILALFEGNATGLWIWIGIVGLVFLLVGFLSSKIMPGEKPSFHMEIPPLRLPKASNVLMKTYTRVHWYFKEIFPMFVLASFFIWVGQMTGLFDLLVRWLRYPIRLIGLPDKAAVSFLFGFFRRDYGAAGFFDMKKMGLITDHQIIVATVTLTLFLPCVAQFLMNVKERGVRMGVAVSLFILLFSFGVGYTVHTVMNALGV